MEEQSEHEHEEDLVQIPDLMTHANDPMVVSELPFPTGESAECNIDPRADIDAHEDWIGDLRLASWVSHTETILVCESLSGDIS